MRSPLGVAATLASLTFLVAGVVWPQAADSLLRMLLVTLALAYVAHRAARAELPERMAHESYSPFRGDAPERPPPETPGVLRALTAELIAADDPAAASRKLIPWPVQRTLIEETSRRLGLRHGLRLDEPAHHPAIRRLVSEATWLIVRPHHPEPADAPAPADPRPVPLSRLALVLDDLETL